MFFLGAGTTSLLYEGAAHDLRIRTELLESDFAELQARAERLKPQCDPSPVDGDVPGPPVRIAAEVSPKMKVWGPACGLPTIPGPNDPARPRAHRDQLTEKRARRTEYRLELIEVKQGVQAVLNGALVDRVRELTARVEYLETKSSQSGLWMQQYHGVPPTDLRTWPDSGAPVLGTSPPPFSPTAPGAVARPLNPPEAQ